MHKNNFKKLLATLLLSLVLFTSTSNLAETTYQITNTCSIDNDESEINPSTRQ